VQGDGPEFSTPLEYLITPEITQCLYDEEASMQPRAGTRAYVLGVAHKYAAEGALVDFSTTDTLPPATVLNGSVYVTSVVGASMEAEDAAPRFSRGLTTTYTEVLKRPYYKAAINPSRMQADSFNDLFKAAALALASSADPRADAGAFIFEWGKQLSGRGRPCG
jgi:hypothetical protein